jgi:guanylate kinase
MIITLTGASGAGKTTIANCLLDRGPGFKRVVSYTTRKPRETDPLGEYAYISYSEFMKIDMSGGFLWSVHAHGNIYGTAQKSVDEALNDGAVYVMILVSQGLVALRSYADSVSKLNRVISFYVISPPPDILRERLICRGDKDVEQRVEECLNWDKLAQGQKEIPYILVNNDGIINAAVQQVCGCL